MKVVITGVTGQDGSWMVEYLLKYFPNLDVIGVVRPLSVENWQNIKKIDDSRFSTYVCDITDSYSINKLISEVKPDYFINFAAVSFVGCSWDLPSLVYQVNVIGVLNILEAIRTYSPTTRFYQASSSEMFGDVITSPQTVDHPLRPVSPYGASKCAAHLLVSVYRKSYDMYAVSGICFNHESSRRGDMFVTKKIVNGIKRLEQLILDDGIKNPAPLVLGNLYAERDWSHAIDIVDGVWKMLNQEEAKDYVLASGKTQSVLSFLETVLKISRFNYDDITFYEHEDHLQEYISYNGIPIVTISKDLYRPAEVNHLCGDASIAKGELGWDIKYQLKELAEEMYHGNGSV